MAGFQLSINGRFWVSTEGAALVGAMASKHDFGGTAYRLSIQQGVLMGRRSEIEAEARKSGGVVTSVSVGGATAYIASGEIEVPPSALVS
jgi:predicted PhzF superfamily epimerase YddE/YHI9